MNATVQKWGNSLALRIPHAVAKDVHLHQGSVVDLQVVEGELVVKPKRKSKLSLSRLLKGVTSRNRHNEQLLGGSQGKEVW
ncbi:MAG: hypothetical protein AUJ52_04365 [Elusimicrobia bacterium CG1_02_63_36]|nr:MAG: hypothetical protein AUJ52_04365 [Elusimicrobia bacterium CG1_02_63_36]PIP82272.1 MAG: AbrB/MazE/SpoVT family DNA-binding domain-containing protein [Elusimicrobia bacterium CG22_combo_CG10-13_8_21_14_all_63_91]PJA15390.1 MAG: AbrB/MazE/SpoVT family DNA-binding domain-containing protein [Elusimicrobia bacterium CG_4_10_14_0_2_um_filter_63_34]PJB27005.1 MAG: AbrB/MazE/SpoVT family DNA-binding domain-containing protein [Elusimicrobia bacterium CG_4_9_14_3_um_filter_62_55]